MVLFARKGRSQKGCNDEKTGALFEFIRIRQCQIKFPEFAPIKRGRFDEKTGARIINVRKYKCHNSGIDENSGAKINGICRY